MIRQSQIDKFQIDAVVVTPEMANAWLCAFQYKRQRRIRARHIDFLAAIMRRGKLRLGTPVDFAAYAGQWYLVNGQHNLSAICQSQTEQLMARSVTQCDSMQDVADLYATHDRNLARSINDAIGAYELDKVLDLSPKQIKVYGAAVFFAATGCSTMHLQGMELGTLFAKDASMKHTLMLDWADEATAFFEAIKGVPRVVADYLHRQAVFGVALITLRHQPVRAAQFWHTLAQDDGLATNDVRKTLLHFLATYKATAKPTHIYAQYVAAAWNAFMHKTASKQRKILRIGQQKQTRPIHIAGTPLLQDAWMTYITPAGDLLKDPQPFSAVRHSAPRRSWRPGEGDRAGRARVALSEVSQVSLRED